MFFELCFRVHSFIAVFNPSFFVYKKAGGKQNACEILLDFIQLRLRHPNTVKLFDVVQIFMSKSCVS